MRSTFKFLCCLKQRADLRLLFLLLFLACQARAADISIASDTWCPFICKDTARPGYTIETVQLVFGTAKYTVEFVNVPFERALLGAQSGQFDAVLLVTAADIKRFKLIRSENPIAVSNMAYYVLVDNPWRFSGIPSLRKQRLGVIQGYLYGPNIDRYISDAKNSHFVVAARGEDPLLRNIGKLLKGRIDVIMENQDVFTYAINSNGHSEQVRFAGNADEQVNLYVGFSTMTGLGKSLKQQFDGRLTELQKSGNLNLIAKKYRLAGFD